MLNQRTGLLTWIALSALAATAHADTDAVGAILAAKNGKEAHAQAVAVSKDTATTVEELAKALARQRTSQDPARRGVLKSIGASLPDKKGRFSTPRTRKTKDKKKAEDERDWLAELANGRDSKAYRDVIADIAVLRALSARQDTQAGEHILKFGFSVDGTAYRDECGRRLRQMAPYSLPALIRAGELRGRKNLSLRRYAIYQLERMDRRSPFKAVGAAPSDSLKAEIMTALAESRHRTGVYAVMRYLDAGSPHLRAAARSSWAAYLKASPRKPPERKLTLPGGKLSDEKVPLWFDHKQLMHEGLRKALEKETGTMPAEDAELAAMTDQLLKIYDDRRVQKLTGRFESALKLAAANKHEEAAQAFDAILAQFPAFERRGEMAPGYLAHGNALAEAKQWKAASTAYGKAHSVAPEGPLAQSALSKHHFARGKEVEKAGGDASAEFSAAAQADPTEVPSKGGSWMLYAGIGGGLIGLVLMVMGLRRRS